MTRVCRRGDLVLIGAMAIIKGDDGEGNEEINVDGFEDGLVTVLDRDVSIDGGTLQTRILVSRLHENGQDEEPRSKRFLDAQAVALAFLDGDEQLQSILRPWLEQNRL